MWSKKSLGFGLIEVMVALTIIIIVMGAAAAITTRSIAVTGSSRDKIVAAGLAQEYIELTRGRSRTNVNEPSLPRPVNGIDYTIDWRVSLNPRLTGDTQARLVVVEVGWEDRATHKHQSYTLETVLTYWR